MQPLVRGGPAPRAKLSLCWIGPLSQTDPEETSGPRFGCKCSLCSLCPVTDRERFDTLRQRVVSSFHGRDMIAGTFG
jgi:hypothetical protein